ncbi:MAG TPA: hypothetical protein V6D28_06970 [Leptolyngbyaceae cyanobacterium]
MSKIKNIQHLAFYAIAISLVLILFKIVTSYGKNIQAPPAIGGYYKLTARNLPECFQSNQLGLIVQQSGIYLNGSLFAIEQNINDSNALPVTNKFTLEKPSLIGHWQNQKITLSGLVSNLSSCQKVNVTLQASIDKENLNGEINLNLTPRSSKFSARKQDTVKANESPKIH